MAIANTAEAARAKALAWIGQWVDSASGQHIAAINPANGELLCRIAHLLQPGLSALGGGSPARHKSVSRFWKYQSNQPLSLTHRALAAIFSVALES